MVTGNRKCAACAVNIANGLKYCPLCGKFISNEIAENPVAYGKVDATYVKRLVFIDACRGASVAGALVCFFINLFTGIVGGAGITWDKLWSLYVIAGILLFNFAVLLPIDRASFLWREIFIVYFSLSAFLIFIDFYSGMNIPGVRGWSIQWMLPCTLGAGTLALTLYNIFGKTDSAASLSAILVCFIFSAAVFGVSWAFYGLNSDGKMLVNVWTAVPSLTALLESGFFFFVLAWVKYKSLQKKFHI